MTRALELQIVIYMIILAGIALMWGYALGHRDGLKLGRAATHRHYLRLADARLPKGHNPVHTEY